MNRRTIVTTSCNNNGSFKAAICIKECAALVGLSRQRFMQLVKSGVFPAPLYNVQTKRPYYTEEMQIQVLGVRKRNMGINGQVVMFYARRPCTMTLALKTKKPKSKTKELDRYADILAGVRGLGNESATSAQVAEAVGTLFPNGIAGVDQGEVIRRVFLYLQGKNTGLNVGRK